MTMIWVAMENTMPMSCSQKRIVRPRSLGQPFHEGEGHRRLFRGHAGRGFVENQQFGTVTQGDGDFQNLLVAVGQGTAGHMRLFQQPDTGENLLGSPRRP